MDALRESRINCPYCGESLTLLLDLSAGDQSVIEDCQVCCQPMTVTYGSDAKGEVWISVDQAQ